MVPPRGPLAVSVLFALLALTAPALAAPKLVLRDGDRVALVGGGLIEREQHDGFLETALTAAHLGRRIAFRNFGWSGDTVSTRVRPPDLPPFSKRYDAFAPTVLIVCYGAMESFDGTEKLDTFVRAYDAWLDKLVRRGMRVVVLSPTAHEAAPGADLDARNRDVAAYAAAIEKLAARRGHLFVDLFHAVRRKDVPLTVDGVHLASEGYRRLAAVVTDALGLAPPTLAARDGEALRAAIRLKNEQFFHHHRPMNGEYVHGGHNRNQPGLAEEVEKFAALAAEGDAAIAALGRRLARGDAAPPIAPRASKRPNPPPPDPEVERRSFQVAPGFEVNLFAADPSIEKPVQIAFDARGRLWVASTTLYPQIRPGEVRSDKLVVLEDADGDGRAEKSSVFADDLYIPTGVLPARDGAYTFDDTTLLFLRDTDGDGRADRREVVLAGFGTEDSHHKGHTFRWTPTGKLHFQQGIFLHTSIETAHGIVRHARPGIFELDPVTGRLDLHVANSVPVNPWGHYWNRWGFDFYVDSSGQAGHQMILPTGPITSAHVAVPGGGGKLVGPEIVSGRHFPPDWQGNVVGGRFMENRVARWAIGDDGGGYAFKELQPLIVSSDRAFRPVETRMGPDGALYIADWYNPLIGHTQHHLHDPRRDFTHGRIWRVTAKGRPLVRRPELVGTTTDALAAQLAAPEDWTRAQARQLLAERPAAQALAAVARWIGTVPGPGREHHRIEALWVQASHGAVDPALLRAALASRDPNARAAAAALLRTRVVPDAQRLAALEKTVRDPHPRVRLHAVVALSGVPDARAVEVATLALDRPLDRHLDAALKQTVMALQPVWAGPMARGELRFGGDRRRRDHVVQTSAESADVGPLVTLVAEWRIGGGELDRALHAIGQRGRAQDLERIYGTLYGGNELRKIFDALTFAARERAIRPTVDLSTLRGALKTTDQPLLASALRLAGAWRLDEARAELVRHARAGTPRGQRAAMEGLAAMGDAAARGELMRLASAPSPARTRAEAIAALTTVDLAAAARLAAALVVETVPGDAAERLLDAFLGRQGGADALATALSRAPIAQDTAKLGLRRLQATGRQHPVLSPLFTRAAGMEGELEPPTPAEITALAQLARTSGDPARGERVFRRPELSCFTCHAINGAGGHLGPDLATVGSGSTIEYLVESLLLPGKVVKDNFETVEVTTTGGESILGVFLRETPAHLLVKDAARAEITIPRASVKDRQRLRTSLMPDGLLASLTGEETADLVRFLSELGKPGAYAVDPTPVVRRWRVLQELPAALEKATPAAFGAAVARGRDLAFAAAFATVSGQLPLDGLPVLPGRGIVVVADLDRPSAGPVTLRTGAPAGLSLWLDGKPVRADDGAAVPLERGAHTLVVAIDPAARGGRGLRVEVVGAARHGSARAER